MLFKVLLLPVHFVPVELELLADLPQLVLLLRPLPRHPLAMTSIDLELLVQIHQVLLAVRDLAVSNEIVFDITNKAGVLPMLGTLSRSSHLSEPPPSSSQLNKLTITYTSKE